jgi:uncharacterized protein YcbX
VVSPAAGTVLSLHRWPVKSMGGEEVAALEIDGSGAAGDRAHAVFDEFKGAPRRLTAREAPRLLAWHATYGDFDGPPHDMPAAEVRAPDGRTFRWDEETELRAALEEDLGRAVQLRWNPHGQQDLPRSVLVTTRATHEAIEAELGRGLDLRRWRTNVHVELDTDAFAEEAWEGRALTIGDATFDLLHPCGRCVIPTRDPDTQEKSADILRHLSRAHGGLFGMNARPLGAARIAVGDPVTIA